MSKTLVSSTQPLVTAPKEDYVLVGDSFRKALEAAVVAASTNVVREKNADGQEKGKASDPEKGPYVHVDTPPTKEELRLAIEARGKVRVGLGGPRSMGKAGGKIREISIPLNFTSALTTTAATDFAGVITLTPTSSTEFTYLVQLYDEMIVDGGKLEWNSIATTAFTTTTGASRGVLCYDPLDSSALASLSNGMQHDQHFTFGTTASAQCYPAPHHSRGLWTFKWRTPRGGARTTANVNIFGHEWSSTSDGGDIYGYLKWFWPTNGATGVQQIYYTWTLNCRFRSRT